MSTRRKKWFDNKLEDFYNKVDHAKMASSKSLTFYVFYSFAFKIFASSNGVTSPVIYDKTEYEFVRLKASTREYATKVEFADFTLESLTVFAFARPDLIRYHLESIDCDVKQVYVVLNRFSGEVSMQMRKVLKLFECGRLNHSLHIAAQNEKFKCLNPFIKTLILLESDETNVGFAGSFNIIAKQMLKNNIPYTVISNDDTRFLPGALKNMAKLFHAKPHVCLYLFSHFSSFGITKTTLKRIGAMDEQFWPAYSEDVDYYYRSVLEGCHIFRASDRDDKLFISHGENTEVSAASTTLKSSEAYRKLIKNTNHVKYGRDAYLCEKWGGGCAENGRDFLNSNKAFKAIFRRKNENHEILYFDDDSLVSLSEHMFKYPFNRTNVHISWWDNDKRAQMSIKSPRCINKQHAPSEFVWKLEDWKLLSRKRSMA